LALPAVETADETAHGIAYEKDGSLTHGNLGERRTVIVQLDFMLRGIPRLAERMLDGSAARLAEVKKVHDHVSRNSTSTACLYLECGNLLPLLDISECGDSLPLLIF